MSAAGWKAGPWPSAVLLNLDALVNLRAPALGCARSRLPAWFIFASALLVMIWQAPMAASGAQTSRIRIEYFTPSDPTLQHSYELLRKRQVLEKMREVFSPFRLPSDLTFRTGSCEGVANAWYERFAVTVCYEYVKEILQSSAKGATADGITSDDAAIGQWFYIFAHEVGHAVFDIFGVPIFGNAEDAADQFATYIMLQFGKAQARRLISGAAYSYREYVKNPEVSAALAAFSDSHGPPAQRFYNLLCLAYGADPAVFGDLVANGYLPKSRARSCKREYEQVAFAFRELIVPHLDQPLAKKVLDGTWLPDVKEFRQPATPPYRAQ
jgi:hypothetical protein